MQRLATTQQRQQQQLQRRQTPPQTADIAAYETCKTVSIMLIYGLEACPLLKSDLSSLNFIINRFFMKLFRTSSIDVVEQSTTSISLYLLAKRVKKFEDKINACNNLLFKINIQ